jgi:hypothetical protein
MWGGLSQSVQEHLFLFCIFTRWRMKSLGSGFQVVQRETRFVFSFARERLEIRVASKSIIYSIYRFYKFLQVPPRAVFKHLLPYLLPLTDVQCTSTKMTVWKNGAVIPPNLPPTRESCCPLLHIYIHLCSFFPEAQTVANHSLSYLLPIAWGSAWSNKWVLHQMEYNSSSSFTVLWAL